MIVTQAQCDQFILDARAEVIATLQRIGSNMPMPRIICNTRLATTAGRAKYTQNTIEINPRLYAKISEAERNETTIHELAHLLSHHLHGRAGHGHGSLWKQTMRLLGQKPDRCHNYDCTGLKRKRKLHVFTCTCGQQHKINNKQKGWIESSEKMAKALAKNDLPGIAGFSGYRCSRCKAGITSERIETRVY